MPPKTVIAPLTYDPTGVMGPETGLDPADLAALRPQLEVARSQILADAASADSYGFIDLPDRLLAEYRAQRHRSEVGRMMKTARRLAELVDRVVLLAAGGFYLGPRALLEACCHPFHNSLGRGDRSGHPRLFFAGHDFDNDAAQGLLDVLGAGRPARDWADRWGIVVISKSGRKLETAVALRQFFAALQTSCAGDAALAAQLVVPVTGASGPLTQWSQVIGCPESYHIPGNVRGSFLVLSPVGLLPAALLGLDVVKLLQGAAAMNAHFRTAPPSGNVVLDFAAVCHAMTVVRGTSLRTLAIWNQGLEATGLWYEHLLTKSLGQSGQAPLPLTAVNPRDLNARGQQPRPSRGALVTNLVIDESKRDRVAVAPAESSHDELNLLGGKTLPELSASVRYDTLQSRREAGCPTADLHLPRMDEASVGQLFQMLMLATTVERRLIGNGG